MIWLRFLLPESSSCSAFPLNCKAMDGLCWLLGTSVHRIGDVCRDNLSRLSSRLHEEIHGAGKSGTGQSLFTEHGCTSCGNEAKRGRVLFVFGEKTGQGRHKHLSPLL